MASKIGPRDEATMPPGGRGVAEADGGVGMSSAVDPGGDAGQQALPLGQIRSRFIFSPREVSGALGDLGTFLPHVIGAITIVGMAPAGILTGFGLFYIFSGLFYGLPMAVQPMKAASAAALVEPMDPGALAGAGIVIGAFFVLAGFSGLIDRIAKVIPPTVASGLQLGLGLSLAALGIRMMADQLWLGVAASALMLVLLPSRRFPAALVALVAGVAVGQIAGIAPPLPALEFGLRWPAFAIPTWEEVLHGTQYAVLPQIPLTLTNAIIVAAAVARQLYPGETRAASERTLALTQGFGTLVTAPFGGYPMCHGAGGIAAHHRFGARTAAAPVLIGVAFLLLGILFGDGAFALLRTVPEAVLGGLLLFSGIDLALSAKLHTYREAELFLVILMAAVGVALNPAAAFAVGLPIAYALKRGWLKF